jgi:hypothetical protein
MIQSKAEESHIVMPLTCPYCQQKQVVQMRARTGFRATLPQSVKCVKCETTFSVNVPDEIIGGPFLAGAK